MVSNKAWFISAIMALVLVRGGTSFALVSINSPSSGATVSGVVTVKAQVDQAWWSKLWVDSSGVATAPVGNVTFTWDTTKIADGTHTMTVKSYAKNSSTPNASSSITVTVKNQSPIVSGDYFTTLREGDPLPSGAWCASHIPWEPEVVSQNAGANSTMPTASQLAAYAANGYTANYYNGKWAYARVDGNYTGTTDMIIRWAACKWGIDEDIVRTQSSAEHWNWHQTDSGGDKRYSYSQCVNGDFTSLWNFMCPNCCFQTWSIWQTKVYYSWQTWPMIRDSTAFAADFRYADQRACMNGDLAGYFDRRPGHNGHSYATDIANGDLNTILWGCIGMHFSGDWYDGDSNSGAIWYIASLKGTLAEKPWHRWTQVNWPD